MSLRARILRPFQAHFSVFSFDSLGGGGGGVELIRLYFLPTTPVVRCIKLFTITLGGGGGGDGGNCFTSL